jgi:hypothetical protein
VLQRRVQKPVVFAKKFDAPSNAKIKGRIGSFGKAVSSWCNPANGPGVEGAYAER